MLEPFILNQDRSHGIYIFACVLCRIVFRGIGVLEGG